MNQKRKEIKKEYTLVAEDKTATSQTAPQAPAEIEIPISFEAWWIQAQSKHNLKPELQEAVKKHFEARGFMDFRKFNAGLRDFGFRT